MNSLKVLHLHIFNICNKIYLLFYIFNEMIFIYIFIYKTTKESTPEVYPPSFIYQ